MLTRTISIPFLAAAWVIAAGFSGAAHAVLQGRDLNGSAGSFEAYYDTDLNITWLTNTYSGFMTWAAATTWAANLNFYDPVNNITYNNWRLPTVNPVNGVSFITGSSFNGGTDGGNGGGYNISEQGTAYAGSTGSEMAYLFYNTLNNKSYCPVSINCSPAPQAGWGLTNTGPFTNLYANRYWATDNGLPPSSGIAWYFSFINDFTNGSQAFQSKDTTFLALAVSPGDVAAVPEPEAWGLMLSGLALIGAVARRRLALR